MTFRSLLFVPGARPDRFEKAIASNTDAVCIDLEDAVAQADKEAALASTMAYLSQPPSKGVVGLRINSLDDDQAARDIQAILDHKAKPAFVMIPKAERAGDIEHVRAATKNNFPIWCLVETPQTVVDAPAIAAAIGENGGIVFGGVDYAASIGAEMGWDSYVYARGCLVNAAAIAGCQLMDVPYLDVKDEAALREETAGVKKIGFTGKACIHPAQIAPVNAVFTPTDEQVLAAERIVAAYNEAGGGVALLDGKLIEKPVLKSAKQILSRKEKS